MSHPPLSLTYVPVYVGLRSLPYCYICLWKDPKLRVFHGANDVIEFFGKMCFSGFSKSLISGFFLIIVAPFASAFSGKVTSKKILSTPSLLILIPVPVPVCTVCTGTICDYGDELASSVRAGGGSIVHSAPFLQRVFRIGTSEKHEIHYRIPSDVYITGETRCRVLRYHESAVAVSNTASLHVFTVARVLVDAIRSFPRRPRRDNRLHK